MPEIQMPKLSDTMTEGTLVAWKKKKGDQVSAGEVLAEIETDKATMEWESPEDGTLTEIYVQEGGKVNVGDKIAFIRGRRRRSTETGSASTEKEDGSRRRKRSRKRKRKNPRRQTPQKKKLRRHSKKMSGQLCQPPETESTQQKPQAREQKPEEARVKASPVARRIAAELGVDLSSRERYWPGGPCYRNRRSRCGEI